MKHYTSKLFDLTMQSLASIARGDKFE